MILRAIVAIIGLSFALVRPFNSNEYKHTLCLVTWDNQPIEKASTIPYDDYLEILARILEHGQ